VHRNLATAYVHQSPAGDLDRAIAALEKAISVDRKYPLHFTELDMLWEDAGVPIERRLPVFEKNRQVVAQRDDSQNRFIALKLASGEYDAAIQMMTGRHFAIVEGANLNVAEHWTNAHLLRGQQHLAGKRYQEALADFKKAAEIPPNLPSARSLGFDPAGDRRAPELAYWTGIALHAMGDHQRATESWTAGTQAPRLATSRLPEFGLLSGAVPSYYQALCLQKLGQAERAKALFAGLVASGEEALKQAAPAAAASGPARLSPTPRARQATAHYVLGLGYLGLAEEAKARHALAEAVRLSPDLLGARSALSAMH
jgi:tetratricopeptide (TPR) repeat protein